MMKSAGFGTAVANPIRPSSRDAHFVGYMFIDDLDLIHSNKGATSKELICEAQEMIRTYARGVRATGGAISPGKCFWSLLHHSWRGDKWILSSAESTPGVLTVEDIDRTDHTIKRLDTHQAEMMLGVYVCLLYTSPSPRDLSTSRMPSSA